VPDWRCQHGLQRARRGKGKEVMIGVLGETIELSGKGFENTRDLLGDLLGAKKCSRYSTVLESLST
jgi:hypothetical protein